jgi:hypothetical protein
VETWVLFAIEISLSMFLVQCFVVVRIGLVVEIRTADLQAGSSAVAVMPHDPALIKTPIKKARPLGHAISCSLYPEYQIGGGRLDICNAFIC